MKIRRWIALLLSVVMLITQVDISSFAAEPEVIYDEVAVLDEMADSWIETCTTNEKACMAAIALYGLEEFIEVETEELSEQILGDVLYGYTKSTFFSFDFNFDIIRKTFTSQSRDDIFEAFTLYEEMLKEYAEKEMDVPEYAIKVAWNRIMDALRKGEVEDGISFEDAIKDNYGYIVGMVSCSGAAEFFENAKNSTDLHEKRKNMLYGALLGNIGCLMSIEDCDVLIKNPEDTPEDKLVKLAETAINLASIIAPEIEAGIDTANLVMDLAINTLAISNRVNPILEYIDYTKDMDDDMNAFFDAISNQYGRYTYEFVNYEIIMDEYKGYLLIGEPYEIVNIPELLYGFPVTGFSNTFASNLSITEITIPSGIVTRPNIGAVIDNCDNLEKIYYNAIACDNYDPAPFFKDCNGELEVIFGEGIKIIPQKFINNCGISEMHIPEGVTTVKYRALLDCPNLKTVTIPSTVTTFSDVTIVSGTGVISGCNNLETVYYNAVSASSGFNVFENCGNDIEEMKIIFGENITTIPANFLVNCGVKTVDFPEGVTLLGSYAISKCNRLETITIPSTLEIFSDTRFGDYIFLDCNNLKTVNYNAPKAVASAKPVFYNIQSDFDVVFGKGIKEIPEGFMDSCDLTSIAFPEGLEVINKECLRNCNALKTVTVPTSVKKMGFNFLVECNDIDTIYYNATEIENPSSNLVFFINNCNNLDGTNMEVVIGDKVTSIPKNFIENCSIDEMIYPEGVTIINANSLVNCSSLKTVVIPSSVTSIYNAVVSGCENLTDLYYGAINAEMLNPSGYIFDSCGNTYGMEIHFTENIKSIPEKLMNKCGVNSVVFPEGITKIGQNALVSCETLESVTLPSSLLEAGQHIIDSCNNLKTLNYNSINIIENGIVNDCQSDFEVNFGSNVNYLPNYFINYSGITNIVIPEDITEIGYAAFIGCKSLESIRFENRDSVIHNSANTIPENTVIYGYYDSTAYKYAVKNNREFKLIKETYTGTLGINNNFYYKYDPATQTLEIIGADEFGLYTDENGLTYVNMPDYPVKKIIFRDCTFTGSLYGLLVDYRNSIEEVVLENCKTDNVTNMSSMFKGCTNLTTVNLGKFNTTKVTDMSELFAGCQSLKEIDLSNFKIYTGCNTNDMFLNASGIDTIHTPYTIDEGIEIILPYDFRDEDSNIISSITTANRRQTINSALIIIGDVNGDGRINVRDVIAVRKYIVDNNTQINLIAADADGNGRINVRDVIAIRKIIVGQ